MNIRFYDDPEFEALHIYKHGIGYQSVEDLCCTFSSWSVGMPSLAPFLNGRQPVLEGIHIAWRSAFTFQSCHFVLSQVAGFIFP
jgi:hypothetical protein